MNRTLVVTLIILLVLILAGAGYLIFQNQKLIKQFAGQNASLSPVSSPQVSPESSISPSPSPSPSPKHSVLEVQENIEAAINSQNTQALVGYMQKPKVNFIIMSSSCCEPMTPDDAVFQLDYAKEGVPFDFNQNTTLVKNLKSKNERLANAYIGISKSKEYLVAFTLNSDNQITQVEVSVSYKLYDQ